MRKFRYVDLADPHGFPMDVVIGPARMGVFPRHTHEFTELVVILDGTGVHHTRQEDYTLGAGDVFVINPGDEHGLSGMRRLRQFHVSFDPHTFLAPVERQLRSLAAYHGLFVRSPAGGSAFTHRLSLTAPRLAALEPLMMRLERETRRRDKGFEAAATGLFLQLVAELCRPVRGAAAGAGEATDPVAQVASLMEAQFAQPLQLEELAARAHLSVPQFCRRFRAAYGRSPMDHVAQLRVEAARELMRDPGLDLTRIAHACGFCDSNYLTRRFRQAYGMTPTAWRRGLTA